MALQDACLALRQERDRALQELAIESSARRSAQAQLEHHSATAEQLLQAVNARHEAFSEEVSKRYENNLNISPGGCDSRVHS